MSATITAPGELVPDAMYTLAEIKRRTGIGQRSLRRWRREFGLRVHYFGRLGYVKGGDVIRLIEERSTDER